MKTLLATATAIALAAVLALTAGCATTNGAQQVAASPDASDIKLASLKSPLRLLGIEAPKQSPAGALYDVRLTFEGETTDIVRICFSWAGNHYSGWAGPYCFGRFEVQPAERTISIRLRTKNPGVYTIAAYAEDGAGRKTNTVETPVLLKIK